MKKIVVFPGWGYPHSFYNLLKDGFGKSYEIEIESVEDFQEKECYAVVAWSMGTLDFFRKEKLINYKKVVLISPTLNFTMTTNVRIIKAMIKNLNTGKEKLLYDFYKNNFSTETVFEKFYKEFKEESSKLKADELEKGLEFLCNEKSNIPIELKCNCLVLTGDKDIIINEENSINAVKNIITPVENRILKSGHNIIYERSEEFFEIAGRYFND